MAEVWLATSKGVGGFQKRVVLKTIIPELAENQDFVKMFINEALLAARLNHAHIVQIFDLGNIEGRYFIAMEYVPGRSLRQISRASRQKGSLLPQWFVLRCMTSVCEALQYAHDCVDENGEPLGLVHRDVTPENVMVSFTGAVKVVDFGVARASSAAPLTRAGTLKGKYSYISPEQVKGATADRRSDIYSLGVVLYEMLVGSRPFRADNDLDLLRQVAKGEFIPPRQAPWINPELEHIILRALAMDPAIRYQEASELNEDILSYLSDVRDRHGQREMSLLVSMLFPDEPAIPSDVLRRMSSNPNLQNQLFSDIETPTPPVEDSLQTIEYAEVEVVGGEPEVDTVEYKSDPGEPPVPPTTDPAPAPAAPAPAAPAPAAPAPAAPAPAAPVVTDPAQDSVVIQRKDSSTFEITGLEDWVATAPPPMPAPRLAKPPSPKSKPAGPAGKVPQAQEKEKEKEEREKKKKKRVSWLSHLVLRSKDESSQPSSPSKLGTPPGESSRAGRPVVETKPARPETQPQKNPPTVEQIRPQSLRTPAKGLAQPTKTPPKTVEPPKKAETAPAAKPFADASKKAEPSRPVKPGTIARPSTMESRPVKTQAGPPKVVSAKPKTLAKLAATKPAATKPAATKPAPTTATLPRPKAQKLAGPTTSTKSAPPPHGDAKKETVAAKKDTAAAKKLTQPRAVSKPTTPVRTEDTPDRPQEAPPAPEPPEKTPSRKGSISSVWDRVSISASVSEDDPIATLWNARRTDDREQEQAQDGQEKQEKDAASHRADEPAANPTPDPMASIWNSRRSPDPEPEPPRPPEPDLASPYGIPTGVGTPDIFHVRRVETDGRDDDVFTAFRPVPSFSTSDLESPSPTPPPRKTTEDDHLWRAAENPDREAAREFEKGLELMRRREYSDARPHWEKAVSLAPENRVYHTNLKKLTQLLEKERDVR